MGKKKLSWIQVVTVLAAVAIVFGAVYIMWNQLGLEGGFDFGAGAYYYSDHPQLQEEVQKAQQAYHSPVPGWIIYLLFFAWGWLMWRAWVWLDKKSKNRDDKNA